MKVFDFTGGTKGKLLGETKKPTALGGWFVKKGDAVFKVTLTDAESLPAIAGKQEGIQWKWHRDAEKWVGTNTDGERLPFTPEEFGVEAICFCTGRWNTFGQIGTSEEEWTWEWAVIGTRDWNRKACKAGILTATKQ